ncbi:MAG TPA: chromate transporter [Methylibium sp.]|nr:chromate transporter [Methylibium sp.]HEU4457734.1 chromate transporter [Methylibium sp.]
MGIAGPGSWGAANDASRAIPTGATALCAWGRPDRRRDDRRPDKIDLPLAEPASCTELFVAVTGLALQGFGGVLPIAQRVLVEHRRWMTGPGFVELLVLAQVLPGRTSATSR